MVERLQTNTDGLRERVDRGCLRLALPTPTLPPATTTNHYIVGDRRAVLVEAATPDKEAQAELIATVQQWQSVVAPVAAIVLTHHHADHCGAAVTLSERLNLPIWAHEATAVLLHERVNVDRLVRDGDVVASNQQGDWVARHTPGHAPGHLALVGPDGGVLVGDLVAGEGSILVDPDDGHMGQYLASLDLLRASRPAWLGPAHGPIIHDSSALLDHYVQHRRARERAVIESLGTTPQAPSELLPRVYGDVPSALWRLALRSLWAHLLWLEEQGLARRHHVSGWVRADR